MEYRIDNTFEIPAQEEWDRYLSSPLFEEMLIDKDQFPVALDFISKMTFGQSIRNYIRQHNNKVGTLAVSYVLCRHYFDQHIPDDPWYISPGKDGQSIQYMPEFQPKDWLKRYWFSYFAEVMYFKIFSIRDSLVGFINEYYQMECTQDSHLVGSVSKKLKSRRKDIVDFLSDFLEDPIYKEAQKYRTEIVHGATPMDVSSGVSLKRNVDTQITEIAEDGAVIEKQVKAAFQLSWGIGDYTGTKTIMDNLESVSTLMGRNIKCICEMVAEDTFSVKI